MKRKIGPYGPSPFLSALDPKNKPRSSLKIGSRQIAEKSPYQHDTENPITDLGSLCSYPRGEDDVDCSAVVHYIASTMTNSQNHHYVSQMFLKNFATREGGKATLFVMDMKSGKQFESGPQNIACEKGFNKIDIGGEDPYAVEKELSKVESEISPALKRVIAERGFPSDEDRKRVLELMALFEFKNPAIRSQNKEVIADIEIAAHPFLRSPEQFRIGKEQAIKAGLDVPDIGYEGFKGPIKELIMRECEKIPQIKNLLVKAEIRMANHHQIRGMLNQMQWRFLIALEGNQFVTSDRPVVFKAFEEGERPLMNSRGLDFGGIDVFFALSPDLALYGSPDASDLQTEFNAHDVARMNAWTVYAARRQVYAKSDDFQFQSPDGSFLTPIQYSESFAV